MNYFELYPGDYLRDTTRLTLVEHGAYLRLLMTYYAEEEALPAKLDELFTIVSATKTAEKEAVKRVAEKFFPVGDDGLRHNRRADDEISKASARMEASPTERKATQAERAKRYRERRSAMFELLREHGIVLDFNAKAEELEAAVMAIASRQKRDDRRDGRDAERDGKRDAHRDERDDVHRDVTASRPQTPDPNNLVGSTEVPPSVATGETTAAGAFCLELRNRGIARVNPQHPDLLTCLALEISVDQLLRVADEGIAKRKQNPFTWALTTALNRHSRGEPIIPENDHAASPRGGSSSAVDRVRANVQAAEQRDRERDAHDDSVVHVIG
jgi:uncharacterized protein YdaU (DUF1376 family)